MAATNVQAFSGDVQITSNLAVDTNTLFVDSVGNKVGIGITNPTSRLHITQDFGGSGPGVPLANVVADDGGLQFGIHVGEKTADPFSRTALRVVDDDETVLMVDGWNKRVGIGTDTPDTMLEVAGNAKISSVYRETFTVSSVVTGTYVYLGRFNTQANAIVEIASEGNSQYNCNKFEFQRQYDATPHVSGIDADFYLRHRFFFKAVNVYEYDLWHYRDGTSWSTPAGTMTYRIQSHIYSKPSDPGSGGAIECVYSMYITNEPGNVKVGIGTYAPAAPLHVNSMLDQGSGAYLSARIGGYDGVLDIGTLATDYGAETVYLQTKIDGGTGYQGDRQQLVIQRNAGSRVGIGTTFARYTLDTYSGTSNARNYKADANNGYSWNFGIGGSEFYIYGQPTSPANSGVYMPFNATSWVPHSSDSRTKKNFTPIENSLEKLRNIRPVLFHYLDEEDTDEKRLGFIAQDWLAQQPECVYHNESAGNLTMSLTETIPVLCAGIKELDSNQQGIQEVVNNLSDFTGQHRCLMKDISPNDYAKYEGLIVSANNNEYLNHNGITKPTINEALPLVSLTNKEKDKTCLGVISLKADPESHLPDDPTRLKINALGEGAIWVTDINGPLESGDYITSSNVAGYGMRQDDEIIHNYTIAKITQDCDFTIKTHKIKKLAKELKDITYYKFTYKVNITKDEYDVTDESVRLVEDYEYYCRKEIRNINETSPPGLYEADAYERIDDIQTVSKEEYDQNQSLYDKKTEYKNKDSDKIAAINEEQYNLDPSKYDVEVTYTTKSKHLSKEEYDKNSSLYEVIKVKIYENKCPKDRFDALEVDNKHEFKLIMSKKYYKLDKRETKEPHPGYETEVRQELVNVLDENGQLTWYETDETETEYDTRYLTSDGSQTDEANTVHIAAFVGCTYHCG